LSGQTITYVVSTDDQHLTMKTFLRQQKGISRKLLVRMKQEQSIFLNGKFTYLDHPIYDGDVISMVMPEEQSENISPQEMEIDIVYEDEDIMVINKSFGFCVHPTLLHPSGTLANGIVHYWLSRGFHRKFRPVNRLDKDTSGLLIIANHQFAHQQLAIAQRQYGIHRLYEAVVHGNLKPDQGTIKQPIARKSTSLMEREVHLQGQEAITHYAVLERYQDATHVQLKLETGRTHQIRVHLSYLGHPLVGDDLYGGQRDWINRQALHARSLAFPHPRTKETMYFETRLPEDMKKLILSLSQVKEEQRRNSFQ
jgi:23S rRNA pseudouridine1911/1915/1917 synthase